MTEREQYKLQVFMAIAHDLACLGTCPRKAVGALIVRDGRCVSWGYNGSAPNEPHCNHSLEEPCDIAVHAEANALAFASRQGISTDRAHLIVTLSPCMICARLLIAAGIARVTYHEAYRDHAPLNLLHRAGVEVNILEPPMIGVEDSGRG